MDFEIRDLTKSFGEKQVLQGINFSIMRGKAIGLLGRNGAGKTTTIRIIMQVFRADSGEVLLDGEPLDIKKTNIGYLPEERGLYPKKKIMDQLIYFARLKDIPLKQARANAEKLLERLDMTQYANSKLDTLSKGNQQKIQLVSTLISEPEIVILDEPFSGLDPVNAMMLKDVVRELIADNKIVILSSHQMNYIEEFCDEIAILNQGKIVLSGNIKEIKRGYDRKDVLVETGQAELLSEALREISDVVESVSESGGGILIKLKRADDKGLILKTVADTGIDIDGFKVAEPSLNDIFVGYTEGAV
ncbi:MAG: ATP-binding cassette domain-containing protein [Oscillospiraceae bacterium]|jgi:ABC-2 type transport system ATP-binding protein|nr:ATP-binding cassette domain-containing protein [Oscillospiraceae bacterium]